MKIDVLTLFPDMFTPVTQESMIGRAVEKGIIDIRLTDIRDFSNDKHNKADDYPFGGGGGMVMMADPIFGAMEHVGAEGRKVIYMSPKGKILDEAKIRELADMDSLVILCGHYEGVDQRVLDYWNAEEISIGDYVLTGGELPAMVLIDSVARLLPGVLGNENSALDESVYSGLLEHPQYTQPREYRGMDVPEVLTSGNHKMIGLWKLRKALEITKERRPDLFEEFVSHRDDINEDGTKRFSNDEKKIIDELNGKDSL
ncbi:MAG: tRNA (guanosine(37)-N1)-methyltransferase TrmD [Clostridia bacterium]|nr:tRNA (guanosine(37)-N1)-methyltransferase TrmD [Clostridia bacterium]